MLCRFVKSAIKPSFSEGRGNYDKNHFKDLWLFHLVCVCLCMHVRAHARVYVCVGECVCSLLNLYSFYLWKDQAELTVQTFVARAGINMKLFIVCLALYMLSAWQ